MTKNCKIGGVLKHSLIATFLLANSYAYTLVDLKPFRQ